MYIKKIRKNGNIHIPVELVRQLPSNEFEVKSMDLEVEPGVVKKCVVFIPVGKNKEVVTYYK